MLLAVDVGNTNMVFGIFEGNQLTGSFRLMTDANRTSDEIGLLIWDYFQRFGLRVEEVEDIIIASVVPQVMHTLGNALLKYFGKAPLVVDDGVDPGLPYGIPSDERLGTDRSVACVAAIKKYGAPLVVVDFGTATTVDAVSRQGTYLGGCIAAGVRISVDALFQKAAPSATRGAGPAGQCPQRYCSWADSGRGGAWIYRSHGVLDPSDQGRDGGATG